MKISMFLLGVMCTMFLISTQNIYSMKRKHSGQKTQTSQSKKLQERNEQQAISVEEEESEDSGQSFQSANEYIKSKPRAIKMLFFKAEMYFNTNEVKDALPIYEKIVSICNDPLALFRIGEIYEKMAEEEPILLTKSYEFYKLALENGFAMALEKLLEIGEALNQMVKESQSKPMSVEVQQMYM
ncbi:MAG: hypothetical protein V1646_04485 [bacterium]